MKRCPSRLWVLPLNDGEAVEIRRLLEHHRETVLLSRQSWGASWAKLEPKLAQRARDFRNQCPGGEIFGVELAGSNPFGAIDIDHHRYRDDDRSHPLASLEQVARILGVLLTRWQLLVAANDRGYIPAMLGLNATPDEIAAVRAQDRAAQGIGPEQERQAEQDLRQAVWRDDKVFVPCHTKPTAAHADRLFDRAREALLVSAPEWDYYGPRHQGLTAFRFPEAHWSGGDPRSGYFGIENPSHETQQKILGFFWENVNPPQSPPRPASPEAQLPDSQR